MRKRKVEKRIILKLDREQYAKLERESQRAFDAMLRNLNSFNNPDQFVTNEEQRKIEEARR